MLDIKRDPFQELRHPSAVDPRTSTERALLWLKFGNRNLCFHPGLRPLAKAHRLPPMIAKVIGHFDRLASSANSASQMEWTNGSG
eukprot:g12004.t1